ncbi:MAG TPA: HYR domain-containing protein, partial [Niastella sp.]
MKDCIVHIFSNRSATLINDSKATNRLCIVVLLLLVFLTPHFTQAQHLDNRRRLDSFQRARTATGATILKVLANSYNVTGGGAYCSGGSGVAVGLSGSEQDTTYQLQLNGVNIGSPIAGNGNAISFGLQTAAGTYTVVANTSTGPMAMNGNVTVTINPLPTVTADPKQVCFGNNSVALTGAPAGGTWSGTSVSGSTFNTNGLSAGNYTVTYSYTDANSCSNTATATVTVNALPTVTADNKQVCFGNNSVALTGAPAGGSWSGTGVSGATFNANTLSPGNYTVTYSYTDANSCTNTATATVTVNALPTVTAANKQVCFGNNSVALTGTPAGGTWGGTGVSGSTFNANGLSAGNYTVTYSYTDANSCSNTATATVTVNALPTVTCPANSSVCISASSFALTGSTPVGGTYSGTGVSGGNFNPATAGVGQHTITYTYTDGNGCTNNCTFNITVTTATTTANAGPDQTGAATCGLTSVTLAANTPTAGTGSWSIVSGAGGTITTPTDPSSTFTGTAGTTYTLRWTITNPPCATSTDDVVITFNQIPTTANAGPDQTDATTCGLTSVTLAANTPTAGTGSWSIVSGAGGTITTPSSPTSTFSGTAGTTYTLRWTITSSPCTSSTDDVIITFNRNPTTANAGSDQALCATTATLAGNTATVGTGTWTLISGAGTITTPGSATSGITGLGVGANTFRWTISNAPCTATFDEVVITRVAATTTANAGPDQTGAATCGLTSVTLAANAPTAGTGSWSIVSGAGGTITTPSDPASTFTGTAGTTYT